MTSCRIRPIGEAAASSRVVDRQQLEVAGAERHDPVVRALPVVVAAGLHGEAERGFDARRRRVEVGGAVDHVVESHRRRKR